MDDCVEVEFEGGGWYWFLVCSECHAVLTGNEKECPNCKKPIKYFDKEKGEPNNGDQETAQPQEGEEASGFQGDRIPSPPGP